MLARNKYDKIFKKITLVYNLMHYEIFTIMNLIKVNPLVFYQKPQVGNSHSSRKGDCPVQIIFPSGGFGLGIPLQDDVAVMNLIVINLIFLFDVFVLGSGISK